MTSLILSLTSTPPVSSAMFHSRPQSLRFTSVSAVKPMTVVFHGDCETPRYSPCSVTGLVTPRTVRSPCSVNSPSPWSSTLVERNVIVG